MDDKPRVSSGIKDTAVALSMTVVSMIASVGIQACLAWQLGRDGRGEFAVCMVFATVMGVAFGCGTDRATQYYLISKRFTVSQSLVVAFVMVFGSSILAIIAGWYVIDAPIAFFDKAEPTSFRIALALIPLTALSMSLQLLLAGLRRFAFAGLSSLLTGVLNLALVLILVAGADLGVNGALLSMVLATLVTIVIQAGGIWKDSDRRLRLPGLRPFLSAIGYGFRYYVARLGNILNIHIGMILLAFIASSKEELGLFAAAAVLIGRILVIPTSVNKALLPRVGEDAGGRPDLVGLSCRMSTLVVGLCVGLLLAISNVLVPVLLSPSFRPCILLLWIMAPGVCIRGGTQPLRSYFIGVDRPGIVSISTGTQLAVNFLLLPVFYHHFQLPGAACAAALGQVAGSLVLIIGFRMVSKESFRQTWRWRRSDTAFLKKILRTMLGASVTPPRQFDSIEDASRHRSKETHKQIVLLEDTVVKRQGCNPMKVELEKTVRGRDIGNRSGLFDVPRVLDWSHESGTIVFERIVDVIPLYRRLQARGDADRLMTTIGRSLACIHNELQLPSQMTVPLPDEWSGGGASEVFIHGDFNVFNLLVRPGNDDLTLIDWAASGRIGCQPDREPTWGTCYFDLAWFVSSLHLRRYLGLDSIRHIRPKADSFLRGYFREANHPCCVEDFREYLLRFQRVRKRAYSARAETGLARIFQLSAHTLPFQAIASYAESLRPDLP